MSAPKPSICCLINKFELIGNLLSFHDFLEDSIPSQCSTIRTVSIDFKQFGTLLASQSEWILKQKTTGDLYEVYTTLKWFTGLRLVIVQSVINVSTNLP
jgi:hypothetical protein